MRSFGDYHPYNMAFTAKAGEVIGVRMHSPPTPVLVDESTKLAGISTPTWVTAHCSCCIQHGTHRATVTVCGRERHHPARDRHTGAGVR